MPKILVTRKLPSSVLAKLSAVADVDLYTGDAAIPADELRARVADKDALVCLLTDAVDRTVIDAAPQLKAIANVAVGYNNIDVAYARSRGIVVTNTPDVLTESVADFTWALILAITRRLSEGERLVRRGEWKGWALDLLLGTELRGKQLGLVGVGRIGRAVAARAGAFGMRVAYTSRREIDVSRRRADVARSAAADVGHRVAARAADAGNAAPDRQARADADEAIGVSDQHRARPGGRRSGAGVGAAAPPARRRGARRLRERTGGASRSAVARERAAGAAPRQRHDRNADGDGGSRGRTTCWRCSTVGRR